MISLSAYTLTTQVRPAPKEVPLPPAQRKHGGGAPKGIKMSFENQVEFARRWLAGELAETIAVAFGWETRSNVSTVAKRLGLPPRKVGRHRIGGKFARGEISRAA